MSCLTSIEHHPLTWVVGGDGSRGGDPPEGRHLRCLVGSPSVKMEDGGVCVSCMEGDAVDQQGRKALAKSSPLLSCKMMSAEARD